jgi:hypothetical protein
LVYKIHGSFKGVATQDKQRWEDREYLRQEKEPSPVIITEEDYISFMTVMGAESEEKLIGIPRFVRSRILNSMLLFLGYGLEDWDIRGLYSGLIQSIPKYQREKSFAIQKDPTNLWKDFWIGREVAVVGYDLYQFAKELHLAYFETPLDWPPPTTVSPSGLTAPEES